MAIAEQQHNDAKFSKGKKQVNLLSLAAGRALISFGHFSVKDHDALAEKPLNLPSPTNSNQELGWRENAKHNVKATIIRQKISQRKEETKRQKRDIEMLAAKHHDLSIHTQATQSASWRTTVSTTQDTTHSPQGNSR